MKAARAASVALAMSRASRPSQLRMRLTGDGDGEIAHVGEVGQAEVSGLMDLPEDHLLRRAVQRPPGLYPSRP